GCGKRLRVFQAGRLLPALRRPGDDARAAATLLVLAGDLRGGTGAASRTAVPRPHSPPEPEHVAGRRTRSKHGPRRDRPSPPGHRAISRPERPVRLPCRGHPAGAARVDRLEEALGTARLDRPVVRVAVRLGPDAIARWIPGAARRFVRAPAYALRLDDQP